MQRLLSECSTRGLPHYALNLDPAVTSLPYTPNIDIRDTVNYSQVMQQYNLGPNGGILTSLNLFATRFDQVLSYTDRRASSLRYVLCDTPGQIEIFTWSASGVIISESLASSYPTLIVYVIDTPRCQSPTTFMSNMLYATSILYKSQLPFILVFNKTDIVSADYTHTWMTDSDAFTAALAASPQATSYSATLTRSMALVLEEFYATLTHVAVSAVTGEGMDGLFAALDKGRVEFYGEFLGTLRGRVERRRVEEEERKERMREKLRKDMEEGGGGAAAGGRRVLVDMKRGRGRRAGGGEDGEEGEVEEEGEEEEDVDEAEEQDDLYERRLAEAREKAEYDEFMQRIQTNRGRLSDDEHKT